VAKGDFSRKIEVQAEGEILQAKVSLVFFLDRWSHLYADQ
jgi:hypothetical protein